MAEAKRQTAERKAAEAKELAEQTRAVNSARKKGYRPDRETLLA